MSNIFIPEGYVPSLNTINSEKAIKRVKDFFERQLATELNLTRVSAPLFVDPNTGLNDNLNGFERPVAFGIREQDDKEFEIVHSLAKWKRFALREYGFKVGQGLYTDMNAIRRDEDTDNIHSIFVDQWDWEKIITKKDRNLETLKATVKSVYEALRVTEKYITNRYHYVDCFLPEEITFVTTQELEDRYPEQTSKEREDIIAKKYGAVFISQIGGALESGEIHDGRAPDYDDWNLNGDIIVYYPILDQSLELSSMGIRVDEETLIKQLKITNCENRAEMPFQKALLDGKLPYTIGGGIGQSRICMYFLRKAHLGEVQASIWPEKDIIYAKEHGVSLL